MTPVLDASVFVAAISPAERHHDRARALFEGHPATDPFLVPDVFRVEVLAALARRGEPLELLDTVDALVRGPRFSACVLDEGLLEEAVRVARIARLRAYDAVYVALALLRGEPLLTLDGEVVSRSTACFPALRIGAAV
jgi:predicted nucleic acid-binding protein